MLISKFFRRLRGRPCTLASFGLLLLLPSLPAVSKPNGPAAIQRLPAAAADTALRYVGQRETRGYNRSPFIDNINRIAGVPFGSSWCMSSAYFSFHAAAAALGLQTPLLRTASVSAQVRYAAQVGSGLKVIRLQGVVGVQRVAVFKGDLLCAKRGGGSSADIGRLWPGHVEIALADYGGTVRTVGGNTSSGGRGSQRDGDGQWIRQRRKNWFLVVIRVDSGKRGGA